MTDIVSNEWNVNWFELWADPMSCLKVGLSQEIKQDDFICSAIQSLSISTLQVVQVPAHVPFNPKNAKPSPPQIGKRGIWTGMTLKSYRTPHHPYNYELTLFPIGING